ncbi:MAG: class I SAM-dependent methyltransferase [Treponemataceae bacterium]|nr:class I SAM-dependent methyltransferase [Treponemataceae bacterium]
MGNTESKGWDWDLVTSGSEAEKKTWLEPSEESYYYAEKWRKAGCRSVLDLGCGLGRHSILFAKYGFKVTATDISPVGLDYLRAWRKEAGLNESILCKEADMKKLPFADNAFDSLFAYHSISHCDTQGMNQIMGEIKRVLKPDGRIFCTLCSKETWAFTEADFPRIDENSLIKSEGPEKDLPHFFVNLDDIRRIFSDFGFEQLRIRHIDECFYDGCVHNHKHYYIEAVLRKAPARLDYSAVLGNLVKGHIDRPLGSCHPRYPDLYCPINYGFVDGVFAGDGAEQDIYLLDCDTPQKTFSGKVIAVYHRFNDVEDKWIVVPEASQYANNPSALSDKEILDAISFQEKYFDGELYR